MKLLFTLSLATAVIISSCGGAGSNPGKKNSDSLSMDTATKKQAVAEHKNADDEHGEKDSDPKESGFGPWEKADNGNKIRRNFNMEKSLGGTRYVCYSSYSSGSSGGTTTETKLQLCSNMTVTIYEQSSVSVYVDGADGNSSSEESDDGTWQFWEDDHGAQYIQFFFKKQGPSAAVYRKEGNKVRLNDRLYHVTKAACN